MRNDFLQHHGILGQKWGVRRFQNKDGTLTPAGVRRARKDFEDRNTRFKDSEGSEYYTRYKAKKATEEIKTKDGKISRYQSMSLREKNNQMATYTVDHKLNAIVGKTIEVNGKKKIVDLTDDEIASGKKLIDRLNAKQTKQWDKEIAREEKKQKIRDLENELKEEKALIKDYEKRWIKRSDGKGYDYVHGNGKEYEEMDNPDLDFDDFMNVRERVSELEEELKKSKQGG